MVYQFDMTNSNSTLAEQGALPVYIQIAELVARQIEAGLLVEGQRLPPEREMARQHGIAVGTLRKSLARLTEMGHLDRRQGSGNYIRRSGGAPSLYSLFRLERPDGGGLPSARLLSFDRMRKPADLPEFGAADTGYRFRRLRFLDNIPVAIEEIWLDGAAARKIDPARVSQSLYQFYREDLGLWITRTEDRVTLAKLPDWTVDQFPLPAGSTVGYVERYGWSQHDRRVEFSRNWFDPTTARFIARQGQGQQAYRIEQEQDQ
ncbi:MAG: GntR family transcriptional regulator [Candidatus Puniceispirillaceae bacterium]|jgi:GntR family transcriptional regulator